MPERAYTDEAGPSIEENGGKMGSLVFMRNAHPELAKRILPMQILAPGQDWHGAEIEPGPDGRYIVRASPQDFSGLVGVIPTEIASDESEILCIIESLRAEAKQARVMSYGKYEDPSYDGNIAIGIQPYLPYKKGSLVEHPNRPGDYVISYASPSTSNASGKELSTSIYHRDSDFNEGIGGREINEETARILSDLYDLIAKSGLVRDDYSFQTEFVDAGLGNITITQARSFIRKQVANFKLKNRERLVFGITPPEGIVLPVLQSTDCFDDQHKTLAHSEPWAFLKTLHDEPPPLDFQPQNLKAYLISQSFSSGITPTLEHHHYRLAQKALITVFEGIPRHDFSRILFGNSQIEVDSTLENFQLAAQLKGAPLHEFYRYMLKKSAGNPLGKIRVISDGRTATVDPVRG